jgi:hypothetical protein
MKPLSIALLCALLVVPRVWADSVILNNGDVVRGEIISETDTQVTIRVANRNGTIIHSESIPKSNIKAIDRETPEARAGRNARGQLEDEETAAYMAFSGFQLIPNQELSTAEYARGIAACNAFVGKYPKSKFLGDVQQRLAAWRDELAHVEKGEVKFNNAWMTPAEKKPLMEAYLAQQKVQGLEQELKALEEQRNRLIDALANTQRAIAECQKTINNPAQTATGAPASKPGAPPRRDLAGRLVARIPVPQQDTDGASHDTNTDAVKDAQSKLAAYQAQAAKIRQQVADLNNAIGYKRQGLSQAKAESDALRSR